MLLSVVFVIGCSSTPTAPTPVTLGPAATTPPVAVAPPVVVAPPVITPSLPTSDPRFDLTFYRQFAHNALEEPNALRLLWRQQQAPKIYLRTIDDAGRAMDALTLDATASAVERTTGMLTGAFGVAGIERGTATRQGQAGWITIRWSDLSAVNLCGQAVIGGDLITLSPQTPGCRCTGGPAVRLRTVKHELGHALGFWHTNGADDLMRTPSTACDQEPTAREQFHAAVAYTMPFNSSAP